MPTTVTSSSYTTIKTSLTSEELPEQPTSVPSESQPSAPREDSATKASSSPYADATAIDVDIPETEQCGNDDRLIMPGLAWTVANSMYNADQMEGTQCTDFKQVLEASDGTRLVEWTSTSTIEKVADTEDLCKGYSNIGIGANLRQRLSDIKEIPAYFKWSRTTDGEFKGEFVFQIQHSACIADY